MRCDISKNFFFLKRYEYFCIYIKNSSFPCFILSWTGNKEHKIDRTKKYSQYY